MGQDLSWNHKRVSKLGTSQSLPSALVDEELLTELSEIPDKMGFKIGEVADLLGLKQYVLRYWESEFDLLKPQKAKNNQRFYTKKDVENALLIRKLLHRDRFSIEGARQALRGFKKEVRKEQKLIGAAQELHMVREQVDDLVAHIHRLKSLFRL